MANRVNSAVWAAYYYYRDHVTLKSDPILSCDVIAGRTTYTNTLSVSLVALSDRKHDRETEQQGGLNDALVK